MSPMNQFKSPRHPPSRASSVALVQMTGDASKERNVEKALERIAEAAAAGANIVCLQELFAGQYPCQSEDHARFDEAEPIPGPTSEALAAAAREHGVVVVGSLFERRAPGLVSQHGGGVRCRRFDWPACIARCTSPTIRCTTRSSTSRRATWAFAAFDTRFGRVGVCVCWDQWYPEAARLTALAGAQMIFYPTAIGWLPDEKEEYGASQHSAWETMMRSHAIANGVFVAAANRTGREGELEFWGASFVADPNGNVLARAAHDKEETLLVECDLDKIDVVRTHWPFLRDRRIDAYGDITKRYVD